MYRPFYRQTGIKDCGPACLKMIAAYHGRTVSIDMLRQKASINKKGVSMLGISEAAESVGFRSTGARLTFDQVKILAQSDPSILHWDQNHFVVLYGYEKRWFGRSKFVIADPANKIQHLSEDEFLKYWSKSPTASNGSEQQPQGLALILEPTSEFTASATPDEKEEKKLGYKYLFHYFLPYRRYFLQIALGLLITSFITLVLPLLTQALIDKGVNLKSYQMVYLVLAGQIALFICSILVEFVRGRILLYIGSRINISMVSDFFRKLFRLPIPFFDAHATGELMQRITDYKRLETLLTVSSLSTVFSVFNVSILIVLLGIYNITIVSVFIVGAALGLLWTFLFLSWRSRLDYIMFDLQSKENGKVIEMLDSVSDIKVNNSARLKRGEWENIQATLYRQKQSNLNVGQIQGMGTSIFSQATNILITFIAATSVIEGSMTLGEMFAVNMVIGQLQAPIQQLFAFVNTAQQARIALNRIGDVVQSKDETDVGTPLLTDIPRHQDIIINDLTFHYGSTSTEPVLKNIRLTIPYGKVTAIVGPSGSGKTTLMKLLLKFYVAQRGSIHLGNIDFKNLHHDYWREQCGVVMQEGRVFNGTIADNISGGTAQSMERVLKSGAIANVNEFMHTLPMGYLTEVGNEGMQLSTGQKQRFLLARAVYKDPEFLFLDEATSALDANNEKTVMENLQQFFKNRTVVVIAHRLSTVSNADQIIVLDKGEVAEAGTHENLIERKGKYFQLVKNQLELGKE